MTLSVECIRELVGEVDGPLLQRALGNLVSNALAYTPSGGNVSLSASQDSQELRIEVKDTGNGIAPEALPRVFDRFYRSDPARARSSGGTGLGLAIMRQIIFLHGGEVRIESEVGTGTAVLVTLPRGRTQKL